MIDTHAPSWEPVCPPWVSREVLAEFTRMALRDCGYAPEVTLDCDGWIVVGLDGLSVELAEVMSWKASCLAEMAFGTFDVCCFACSYTGLEIKRETCRSKLPLTVDCRA